MKYSEFYKLIESAGWTIRKGKRHYKYVLPDFDYFIPVGIRARKPERDIGLDAERRGAEKVKGRHPPKRGMLVIEQD